MQESSNEGAEIDRDEEVEDSNKIEVAEVIEIDKEIEDGETTDNEETKDEETKNKEIEDTKKEVIAAKEIKDSKVTTDEETKDEEIEDNKEEAIAAKESNKDSETTNNDNVFLGPKTLKQTDNDNRYITEIKNDTINTDIKAIIATIDSLYSAKADLISRYISVDDNIKALKDLLIFT